jgi:hypothetical protein
VLIALRPDQGLNVWALVALAGTVLLGSSLAILRKMMESETPEMAAMTASGALSQEGLRAVGQPPNLEGLRRGADGLKSSTAVASLSKDGSADGAELYAAVSFCNNP